MIVIKYSLLILIFVVSSAIGKMKSEKYYKRVEELREIENMLCQLKTKIRFTASPLREIFQELASNNTTVIGIFLEKTSENMEENSFNVAWNKSIEEMMWNLNEEDISILKDLGKILGKSDVEGQVNEIELVRTFIEKQTQKAEVEKSKNAKIYKTLGNIIGIGIVIILI